MIKRTILLAAIALAAIAGTAANARTFTFDGSLYRSNPGPTPGLRCAPKLTIVNNNVGTNIATGTSTIGDFLETATACIVPPLPTTTTDGLFSFDFGDGTIYGTTSSLLTFSATPLVFNIAGHFDVTGGTGRYYGFAGSFDETGTLDRTGPLAVAIGTFTGTLSVAEPLGGGLLLGGLLGLGLAVRKKRAAG